VRPSSEIRCSAARTRHDATPLLERFFDRLLAIVERLDALVGLNNAALDGGARGQPIRSAER